MSDVQYPPGYLEENVGYKVVITAIVFILLDSLFVILRYVARHLGRVPAGLDDYLIAAAWVVGLGESVLSIGITYLNPFKIMLRLTLHIGTAVFVESFGFGHHSAALRESNPGALVANAKGDIAHIVLYCVSCVLPRLAIIYLYLRIFLQHSYRIICYITAAALVGIFSSLAIVSGFQCTPFSYIWDKTINGHCINTAALYRWSSLPNVIADVVLLILPLPTVWNLHAPRNVKVGLFAIFTAGNM